MECLNNMLLKWLTWHSVYALEDDLDISLNSHTSMWVSHLLPATCLCPEHKQAIDLKHFVNLLESVRVIALLAFTLEPRNVSPHVISSYRCNKSVEVLPEFYLLWVSVMKRSLPIIGVPFDLPFFVPKMRLNSSINFSYYLLLFWVKHLVTTFWTFPILFYSKSETHWSIQKLF